MTEKNFKARLIIDERSYYETIGCYVCVLIFNIGLALTVIAIIGFLIHLYLFTDILRMKLTDHVLFLGINLFVIVGSTMLINALRKTLKQWLTEIQRYRRMLAEVARIDRLRLHEKQKESANDELYSLDYLDDDVQQLKS